MRGDTLNVTRRLVTETCISCGIEFAFPEEFKRERLNDHRLYYCPNGHSMFYGGKSEAEKLREKLAVEQKNSAFWRQREADERQQRDHAERQRDAYKGHNTRLKKRVAGGKCPCCSTSFNDLAAHMAEKHPDYAPTATDAA